jgi:hypothetical protein
MNPPRWSSPYSDRVRDDLVRMVEHDGELPAPLRSAARSPGRGVERPRVIATAVVAVLVVGVAVLAVRVGIDRRSDVPATRPSSSISTAPTTPATTSPQDRRRLREAVLATLPKSARSAPALTWTEERTGPTGGAIDTTDRTMLLSASCEGGGSLTITVTGRPDRVLDCSRATTVGPIDLSAAAGSDPPGSVEFDVRVSAGAPRFFALAVAVASSSLQG